MFIGRKAEEPTTVEEAWNCKDPTDYQIWRNAVQKKFKAYLLRIGTAYVLQLKLGFSHFIFYMEDKKLWDIMPKAEVPEGRSCIKCKWINK
jgi:hypothetical protein